MSQFDVQLRRYTDQIEGYLQQCFLEPDEPQQELFEAMRYSLLAGGKRIRPVLTLSFCAICGGSQEDALPFAAAVEKPLYAMLWLGKLWPPAAGPP